MIFASCDGPPLCADGSWRAVWAKTGRDERQVLTHWLPLPVHLSDTAAVAGLLLDRWVPPQIMTRIARDLTGDEVDVRRLVVWLAAVHDVGKASPAFVVQAPQLADALRRHGLESASGLAVDPERSAIGHQLVGQVAVEGWLRTVLGFDKRGAAAQLAAVVGSHHGVPPTDQALAHVRARKDLAGTGDWELARTAILTWAAGSVGGPEALARYKGCRIGRPSQALLTAIVIMADWIASNVEFFPLEPLHTADEPPRPPDPDWTARRVEAAWRALGLPDRWSPRPLAVDVDTAFADRFGTGAARPVQIAAVKMARTQERPGLMIIEAPMGEGKTEAALLAAEVLAERCGAAGCFVALPTRATSDAMFSRLHRWLQALPGLPPRASVTLAHGTANLNDEFSGLVAAGRIGGIAEDGGDDGAAVAHHWLRGRKKGPLAQFTVGTVDQVLFAGLKSRHLMLRHFALAGKVVIIDEVHAYDVYMSEYLDRVLHWLGAYGVPVVLLSATLPPDRRAALLCAYDSGCEGTTPQGGDDPGYPVVLATGAAPRPVSASSPPTQVAIERVSDDLEVLVVLLRERLVGGGCAVVVRNTVGRVQETADRLVAEFGEESITVNHSRFLACDRSRTDRNLLRRFGPPGAAPQRPYRHVVVASQVVEQSLDVDFDLMVTDLAPVDLVLQRIGRLHRHRRDRPPRLRYASCVLVGVEDWTATPVRAIAGSRRVYSEHTLLRSAALLTERDVFELPADIGALVRLAYGANTLGPPPWQAAMDIARRDDELAAEDRRDRARAFLLAKVGRPTLPLTGWVTAGVGDAEDDPRGVAQVRDGGEDLDVLVVMRDRDGGLLTPDWIERAPDTQIPLDQRVPEPLARVVAACSVRLPRALCHEGVIDRTITALEREHFTSFDQSPLLSGRLVLALSVDRTAELHLGPELTFRLTYDPRRGLHHERI